MMSQDKKVRTLKRYLDAADLVLTCIEKTTYENTLKIYLNIYF